MPDIPLVGGQMIEQFGRQVQQFGNTLLDVAGGQVGKVLYDGVVTQELTAAKSLFYKYQNEFNYAIETGTNVDYKAYRPAWDETQSKVLRDAVARMTTQESKDRFTEWLTAAGQSNSDWVKQRAVQGLVADAEVTALNSVAELARMGNEPGILDTVRDNVRGNVWTGDDGSKIAAQYIPQARYNNIQNQLDALGDPEMAIRTLMDSDADTRFGLPATGDGLTIENMRKDFEAKLGSLRAAGERQREVDGLKSWEDFDTKWLEAPESMSRSEVWGYVGRVDDSHRDVVTRRAEQYDKLFGGGLEERITRAQDKEAATMLRRLYEAKATGAESPWKMEDLETFLEPVNGKPPRLRANQIDGLRTAFLAAEKTGTEAHSYYSRLYDAMDNNKNPAMAVRLTEIDAARDERRVTDDEHRAILATRLELQNQYESGADSSKAETLIEAYRIAHSSMIDSDEKRARLDALVGQGLSAKDGQTVRGWVDPYNDDADRKRAVDAITKAYEVSMTKPDMSTQGRKDLALELYYALDAMERVFTSDPSKGSWNTEVENVLTEKAVKDVTAQVLQATGQDVTGYGTGERRPKYREATALEYLREQGKLTAEQAGQFPTEYRDRAEQLETDAFRNAGLSNSQKFRTRLSGGDLVYSPNPIQRDAQGRIIPRADLYQVRYQIVNGKYVPTVYQMDMTAKGFTKIVWQQP